MKNKTYMEVKENLLNNLTIQDSLKAMINLIDDKDCVDNYYNVKTLLDLCLLRLIDNNVRVGGK